MMMDGGILGSRGSYHIFYALSSLSDQFLVVVLYIKKIAFIYSATHSCFFFLRGLSIVFNIGKQYCLFWQLGTIDIRRNRAGLVYRYLHLRSSICHV